jgi:hypothetical protein
MESQDHILTAQVYETLKSAGLQVIESSIAALENAVYALADADNGQRRLVVVASSSQAHALNDIDGEPITVSDHILLSGPLSATNAAALRKRFTWLCPQVIGLQTSIGLGDRLGLATPGHLRALRQTGATLAPIPAQQSMREMSRTGRTPRQVLDDAMWGVFAEGWRTGFGADADHLKTTDDIDSCLEVGYTLYTFDPGAYVDNTADSAVGSALRARFETLPWQELEDTPEVLLARYRAESVQCEQYAIHFDPITVMRSAVKYGRAIAHVTRMYRHLAAHARERQWEVEVSVDETETPTTHAEHVYIATELRRLGVRWTSLAPRYIGRFEKGIDYLGDVEEFERDLAIHAAIARTYGPYKLSIHSGSDKFAIFPAVARQTSGQVHLKTAGTSYLEALRTIAMIDPALFRSIYAFACEHYEVDRASYHVSADLHRAPNASTLTDTDLESLLQRFDTREILHVTFGSVLTARTATGAFLFADRLMDDLRRHRQLYAANLEKHFTRHILPFVPYAVKAVPRQ